MKIIKNSNDLLMYRAKKQKAMRIRRDIMFTLAGYVVGAAVGVAYTAITLNSSEVSTSAPVAEEQIEAKPAEMATQPTKVTIPPVPGLPKTVSPSQ